MEFKSVVGYEGKYEVSKCGTVRSIDRYVDWRGIKKLVKGKELKPYVTDKGYGTFRLSDANQKFRGWFLHRIVALAWIGEPDDSAYEINHKDGNKMNNHVDNLEWVSHLTNIRHAWETGLSKPQDKRGVKAGRVILTEEQVLEIREAEGPHKEIGAKYGISYRTVGNIKSRRCWKHI